jgi:hypothetical protein
MGSNGTIGRLWELFLRLSTVKTNSLHLNPHDWFVVIVGEALVVFVLAIGWFVAKRKYIQTYGHHS